MMLTLWDLVEPLTKRLKIAGAVAPAAKPRRRRPRFPNPLPPGTEIEPPRARPTAQSRYDAIVREMLDRYQIRVRKWRTSMSGVAWYVTYTNGRRQNLIEAPRPRGPMSAVVFLHEVGHHAIGFDIYKPRCLEEYHAWRWAIEMMELYGLNVTDSVRFRMHQSLHYAIQKARRRGIKVIPPELTPYLARPVKPRPAR